MLAPPLKCYTSLLVPLSTFALSFVCAVVVLKAAPLLQTSPLTPLHTASSYHGKWRVGTDFESSQGWTVVREPSLRHMGWKQTLAALNGHSAFCRRLGHDARGIVASSLPRPWPLGSARDKCVFTTQLYSHRETDV